MPDVVERFLRYCAQPSQSDPANADHVPSTPDQHLMAALVADDLRAVGALDVAVDDHAYVTARWPASPGCEDAPCMGLCAHLDTAWQAPGSPVRPRVVRYEGGPLVMGEVNGRTVATGPEEVPELEALAGSDIVVTDGTSILGADDKAGVAEIVSYLARLAADPTIEHPALAIAFVPDEEIGHGAALLDLDAWGADYGYTLDSGPLGECAYETFNACEAQVRARGVSVHTGKAKGIMVNASEAIVRFHQLLPPHERPELTEGREGFFYLERMEGECERASSDYIVRDHDAARFEARKECLRRAAAQVDAEYGEGTLELSFVEQYRNMAEKVMERPELVDLMLDAFRDVGVEPYTVPMRGGTDGAQLTFRGLPCPNMSAGFHNAHGCREFAPVPELETMVDVLVALGKRAARMT